MTELTLTRKSADTSPFAGLIEMLKDAFAATPLGLMLAAFARG